MLAAILCNQVRLGHPDTHDGGRDELQAVEYLLGRLRERRLARKELEEASRGELVTEAYTALQDVPEVRQEIRAAVQAQQTPELAQILTDYRAMNVLLKRYEALLEDDDEAVMLLGGF